MFHRIKSITPLSNQNLKIYFMNGEQKKYDVKKLFDRWPQFKALKNDQIFQSVTVAPGGFGIVWNDFLDLSCDELWEGGY